MAAIFFMLLPAIGQDRAQRLVQYLEHSSYKVRLKAAIQIGRLRIRQAAPALKKSLSDDNDLVRAAAAYSLGQLGDQSYRKDLITLLKDPKTLLNKAATKALKALDRAQKTRPMYLVVLNDPILVPGAGKGLAKRLKRILKRDLAENTMMVLSEGEHEVLSGQKLSSHLKARGLKGISIRPKLTTLSVKKSSDSTTFKCKISIMVLRLLNKRMEFDGSGEAEATVEQTDMDPDTMDDIQRQLVDAAVKAAREEVVSYLARRTGP